MVWTLSAFRRFGLAIAWALLLYSTLWSARTCAARSPMRTARRPRRQEKWEHRSHEGRTALQGELMYPVRSDFLWAASRASKSVNGCTGQTCAREAAVFRRKKSCITTTTSVLSKFRSLFIVPLLFFRIFEQHVRALLGAAHACGVPRARATLFLSDPQESRGSRKNRARGLR